MSDLYNLIKNYKITVYDKDEDIQVGLLRFEDPPLGEAFIFKFDTEKPRTFHTMGMKFNIDIYFFNEKKELIYQKLNCDTGLLINCVKPAKYVVEIPS